MATCEKWRLSRSSIDVKSPPLSSRRSNRIARRFRAIGNAANEVSDRLNKPIQAQHGVRFPACHAKIRTQKHLERHQRKDETEVSRSDRPRSRVSGKQGQRTDCRIPKKTAKAHVTEHPPCHTIWTVLVPAACSNSLTQRTRRARRETPSGGTLRPSHPLREAHPGISTGCQQPVVKPTHDGGRRASGLSGHAGLWPANHAPVGLYRRDACPPCQPRRLTSLRRPCISTGC